MAIRPENEAALASAVAEAAGAGRALCIQGGGTRLGLGHPVEGDVLETGGLSGITLYEPGALTLVAEAGTPLAEIEAALAAEGQMLPFEPMDHRGLFGTNGTPTIGGVVACNVSGPRRIQAGACRDSLLGVRFVDGRGTVIKNGGRVMKNVTGYDLVKLLAGSYGTLGVLTEVSLKVLPRPEATGTVVIGGLADGPATEALRVAMASPFDVSGAAHLPEGADGPVTLVRVEGFEASVAYRLGKLTDLLAPFGGAVETSGDPALWEGVRDGASLSKDGCLWRLSVRPTSAARITGALGLSLPFRAAYDWAGGLIWIQVSDAELMAFDAVEGAVAMTDRIRSVVAAEGGGDVTLIRAPDAAKDRVSVFQPEAEPLRRISDGLRAKFDPEGILNPGRLGAPL